MDGWQPYTRISVLDLQKGKFSLARRLLSETSVLPH